MTPTTVSHHRNSQGEEIAIERVEGGEFAGQLLLVMYDDPPMRTAAPMLLDEETKRWLCDEVAEAEFRQRLQPLSAALEYERELHFVRMSRVAAAARSLLAEYPQEKTSDS